MPTKTEFILSQLLPGETASDLTSRLNLLTTIKNPIPLQYISAPPDLAAIRAAIPDEEAFAIMETRTYDRLLEAVSIRDKVGVYNHLMALKAGGRISDGTLKYLLELLASKIPDPAWQPMIESSLAQQNGFEITVNDVEQAMLDGNIKGL